MSSMTAEQRRAFFAKKSFQGFVSKGDLEKIRKQHNELNFMIQRSQEKERFYEDRIRLERGHQRKLEDLRSRL